MSVFDQRDPNIDASFTVAGAQRVAAPNVRDFGVYGDGVTDDSGPLATLLAQTNAHTFYLPEGTYLLKSAITVTNRRLIGAGMGQTILTCPTSLSYLNGKPASGTLILNPGAGGSTAAIAPASLTAAGIQSALDTLLGAGKCTVTDFSGGILCGLFRVEWIGTLGLKANGAMTVTTTLAGGPTATVVHVYEADIGSGAHNQIEYVEITGTAVPLVTLAGSTNRAGLADLTINGPGSHILGVRNAGLDGLKITGSQLAVRRVNVQACDDGFRITSASGHITLHDCYGLSNYYGLGIDQTGNDLSVDQCIFDTSNLAAVGVHTPTTGGLADARFLNGWGGNAPFGIFQEIGAGAAPFIASCRFRSWHFEACGNGAIYSDNSGGKAGGISDTLIDDPGYSVVTANRLNAYPHDYATVSGAAGGLVDIRGGAAPFSDGAVNTHYFGNLANTRVVCRSNNPEDADAGTGTAARFQLWRNQLSYQITTGVITAGNTSVTLTLPNILPANTEGFLGNAVSMQFWAIPNDLTKLGGINPTRNLVASNYVPSKIAASTVDVGFAGAALASDLAFTLYFRAAGRF